MKKLILSAVLIFSSTSTFANNRLDLAIGGQAIIEANTVTHVTCAGEQNVTFNCSINRSGSNIHVLNGQHFVTSHSGMNGALSTVKAMTQAGLCGSSSCSVRGSGIQFHVFDKDNFIQSFSGLNAALQTVAAMRDAGLCR